MPHGKLFFSAPIQKFIVYPILLILVLSPLNIWSGTCRYYWCHFLSPKTPNIGHLPHLIIPLIMMISLETLFTLLTLYMMKLCDPKSSMFSVMFNNTINKQGSSQADAITYLTTLYVITVMMLCLWRRWCLCMLEWLTHLPLVPNIWVSESGQHLLR